MRIDTLSYSNAQMQGSQRRAWLRQYAPQHLQHCTQLVQNGLQRRQAGTSRSTLVLGAGACTEVPLAELTRASDEVALADLDQVALQQGRDELASSSQRKRVRLITGDLSGGVSAQLDRLIKRLDWNKLAAQGAQVIFDAAAQCLEQCYIPDPIEIEGVGSGEFGLVVSSLVLSQLFSYPLLDLLDHIQNIAPDVLGEQERHRRYQDAAQQFRVRIIDAHLHLLRMVADLGASIVLLSDIRGFVFTVYGTDHDAQHRRSIPLVPRVFPEHIRHVFNVIEEFQWEWLTDLPEQDRPGRGYEVAGYVLEAPR